MARRPPGVWATSVSAGALIAQMIRPPPIGEPASIVSTAADAVERVAADVVPVARMPVFVSRISPLPPGTRDRLGVGHRRFCDPFQVGRRAGRLVGAEQRRERRRRQARPRPRSGRRAAVRLSGGACVAHSRDSIGIGHRSARCVLRHARAATVRLVARKVTPIRLQPRRKTDRDVHGRSVSYVEAGSGPCAAADPRHGGHGRELGLGDRAAGARPHRDRPRLPRPRPLGARRRRLLARQPRQRPARPAADARATSARPWSATRSAAASRCSSPTSSRRWSSAWCWSPAAASAPTSARSCGRRRCPAPTSSSPPPPASASRSARLLGRGLGLRRPAPQRRRRRGRPRLRLARRPRAPQGLPGDPALGGRHRGPARRRPRQALPRRGPAAADRLGRPRPDHPRRPRPRGPRAAARQPPGDLRGRRPRAPARAPRPLRRRPRALPRRDRAGRASTATSGGRGSRPPEPVAGRDAPGRIRTCDLFLRREALYPAELRALSGPV